MRAPQEEGGASEDTRLTHLVEATLLAIGDLDLGEVLRRIVEATRSLVGARYSALGVIGPDGKLSEFVFGGADRRSRTRSATFPRGTRDPGTPTTPTSAALRWSTGAPRGSCAGWRSWRTGSASAGTCTTPPEGTTLEWRVPRDASS
ncbi:MAG: hypothetical protein M3N17_00695 [Actinomycetota bacterium]|nr:hypothetical protein [Actinomycetota bacterium]